MGHIIRNESMDVLSSSTRRSSHDRYSVITPSIAQFTRASSNTRGYAHASDPNPTHKEVAYGGAREMNSSAGSTNKKMFESMKFGKKMIFGQQDSNHQVLEEHLKQIRNNMENKQSMREQ